MLDQWPGQLAGALLMFQPRLFFVALWACMLSVGLLGPARAAESDEEGTYGAIEEILVTAPPLQTAPVQATQQTISAGQLSPLRPLGLDSALSLAPGASVQVNSRGETLIFLRSTGERQVATYYDGAALNVPWDNRLDLALIPADALGGLTVTKGPVSVRYGANTAGGAVELTPILPGKDGLSAILRSEGGLAGLAQGSGLLLYKEGDLALTFGAGHLSRGAQPLADDAQLPFSQDSDTRRTNTDLARTNAIMRAAYDVSPDLSLAASLLYIDGSFGIAPESNRDPREETVRFWRYPQLRHILGVLSSDMRLGVGTDIKTSIWVQDFDQAIESYGTARFDLVNSVQEDDNRTLGLRTIATHRTGQLSLRGSLNASRATHEERTLPGPSSLLPFDDTPDRFAQTQISLGGEAEYLMDGHIRLLGGVSVDLLNPTRTGGRPDSGDFTAWNAIAGVSWRAGRHWSVRASAGRKVRLPTLRELFGVAINRFLINPNLTPETAILSELGVSYGSDRISFEAVAFSSLVADLIDQRNVQIDGANLRQRVNLPGSRVIGVELSGQAQLTDRLTLSGHFTASQNRRRGDTAPLIERPNIIGRVDAAYTSKGGFGLRAELDYRGRAFSLLDDDSFARLSPALLVNLQVRQDILIGGTDLELYLRADNVFDRARFAQAGLPSPGRWVRGGIVVGF